jgi:hypothetical protein
MARPPQSPRPPSTPAGAGGSKPPAKRHQQAPADRPPAPWSAERLAQAVWPDAPAKPQVRPSPRQRPQSQDQRDGDDNYPMGSDRPYGNAAPARKMTHPDGQAARRSSKAPTAEVLAGRWSPDLGILPDVAAEHVRAWLMPDRVRGDKKRVSLIDVHANAVRELSIAFTAERKDLAAGYLSQPRYRAAYLLYYLLTGAASTQSALHLAGWTPPETEEGKPLRILDLGAGPLTASLGVVQALGSMGAGVGKRKLQVTALDGVAAALNDGAQILRIVRPDAEVITGDCNLRERKSLKQALKGRYDLILLANVLNEWALAGKKSTDAAEFVQWLLDEHLSENGTVLLLEPATRNGSHVLIDVREHLLAAGDWQILAPCRGTAACPYAERGHRDWCFSDQPWRRPDLIMALDDAIDHERGTLKFSYLVLQPGAGKVQRSGPNLITARAIGGPMKAGGTYRRYVCGPDGRLTAVVPDRQRVPDDLLHAFRGDQVTLQGKPVTVPRGRRTELELHLFPEGNNGPLLQRRAAEEPREGHFADDRRPPRRGGWQPRGTDQRGGESRGGDQRSTTERAPPRDPTRGPPAGPAGRRPSPPGPRGRSSR